MSFQENLGMRNSERGKERERGGGIRRRGRRGGERASQRASRV